MPTDAYEPDEQDQAEVFDEDNLTADDDGGRAMEFRTFEELPDVYDVTQRQGDRRDEIEMDEASFDPDGVEEEDLEEEDEVVDTDVYDETDEEDVPDEDAEDGVLASPPEDVDLEYQPDVQDRRGAQASAAHFEAKGELDDTVLEELGYRKPSEDQ
ncbi:MAG: hypothetical protein JSR45_05495 [Proteobacteria bacterium]|nr:hypothetical protein [Pseudomonadota bacterium]